ncbi:MAG: NAD-dependent epimerase/dehydratase family protein [Nitrospina sp.]|jgi:CDP-paratose 2-epimerase|nr:NAD-dependent epimerase/dehydratase family protein [Nitrospina sp.]
MSQILKHILITGGAGFVGSNLGLLLKRDNPGVRVTALDNLKRRGSELNLPRLRKGGIQFTHGDIRNREDLNTIPAFDLILECSAEPSVLAGYDGLPDYVVNTNLMGTVNCLEAARLHGANMVFLSTSRVYPIETINKLNFEEGETRFELSIEQTVSGIGPRGLDETFPLEGGRSLYGTTKLCSEFLLQEYIAMYGMKGVINRCGVLTGPWQMGKVDQGVVVHWAAQHVFGGELAYIGYGGMGKQVRDVLHVEDLYDLINFQLEQLDKHNGKVYNVGGGREVSLSLLELTRLCQKASGRNLSINSVPETRSGDIPLYISDCTKVELANGWKPRHQPEEIIDEIVQWISDNKNSLRPVLC